MKHKPAMYALLRLHAELGGKLNDNRKEAERIVVDMQHVEAVLRMFEPGFDVTRIAARRRYRTNAHFKRGTIFNHALNTLRVADRPLTSREIAFRMLQERGIAKPSKKLTLDTIAAIHRSLQNHRGERVFAHDQRTPMQWSVS